MNRRENGAFTGWPPVLIFSKEQEKEKPVWMCVAETDREGEKEKELASWREDREHNVIEASVFLLCTGL